MLYDASVVEVCTALISQQGFDFETKFWQRRTSSERES
jgi:hypothetical protein